MAATDVQANADDDVFSYLTPIGYRQSSHCGYCHRTRTGHSYFARSADLSPAYYQSLIGRCWRRSGTLLYRPNQKDACCPHYTLRLDSSRCKTTKHQRQAINRFNRFVIGDDYAKAAARLRPKSREQAKKRDNEFDLVERIHEAESQVLTEPPKPAHSFTVSLESDAFTEEKWRVFENYQRVVHQEPADEISRDGFKRFLCSSPLRRGIFRSPDGRERQVGSFHQCYRLDGELVAVGVLDLLPDGVSAVYFLYHESIEQWSPGKLGALREIALAAEGGYRWWYSGFYIHTCTKMRYKMDYSPQYILNPDVLEWVHVDKSILALFDRKGYIDFSRAGETGEDAPSTVNGSSLMDLDEAEDDEGTAGDADSDPELSLLQSNMPGLPLIEELSAVDYDRIPVRIRRGYLYAGDLLSWQDESITTEGSPKAIVAELVAAVGPDLMRGACLDFSRGGRA